MPDRARIVVSVAADGTVTAETHGVLGGRCLDYIAVLEDLLAARTVHSTYTADYSRTAVEADNRQEGRDVDLA